MLLRLKDLVGLAFRVRRSFPSLANHSEVTSEVNIIDVEHILRDTYIELEYFAQFAMSLQSFSQLPKDQKWLLFRNFWPGFFQLDRNFHTCKLLGYDINDERTVCFDGTIVNLKGHVTRLDMVSDLNEEQVRKVMKPSNDLYRELVTYPFKRLRPNEFELLYMVISCMWNVKSRCYRAGESIYIDGRFQCKRF
uniref:NR LBD domain-containing protein n=1 Tax=Angiostrongylus cantonensis TaxID=6313 RepID=A0A0K0DPI8_ANGCA